MTHNKMQDADLDGYPAALILMVSSTPHALSCCTARTGSKLPHKQTRHTYLSSHKCQSRHLNSALTMQLMWLRTTFLLDAVDIQGAMTMTWVMGTKRQGHGQVFTVANLHQTFDF